jgi:hypothetical protein
LIITHYYSILQEGTKSPFNILHEIHGSNPQIWIFYRSEFCRTNVWIKINKYRIDFNKSTTTTLEALPNMTYIEIAKSSLIMEYSN